MLRRILLPAALSLGPAAASTFATQDWEPAPGPLLTRWAADVSPTSVHPEYPRPQMVRADWSNLNGLWSYAIAGREAACPAEAEGRILVPFPVESALSGVMRRVSPEERLWCWRSFEVPAGWAGRRVLLHFGAVDWEARVWVNGRELGSHRGGYDPFHLDVTDALVADGPQELVVACWDPTDAGTQPRGKQVREPRGIWYTPTTGIWRTVWLEPVNRVHVERLKMVPDLAAGILRLSPIAPGLGGGVTVEAVASLEGRVAAMGRSQGTELSLRLADPRPWSPDDPVLYHLVVRLRRGAEVLDEVQSYFGMRSIELGQDGNGITRLFLNGRPLFHFGPLDQGFWPDGLYTAPTDEALRYDVEVTRQLGFNAVRKHVKIEPDRWYYWCDRLGLLVWQDMPSGDRYIGGGDPDVDRDPESARQFELELERNVDALHDHPCIVMWVPYNEGWGQYATERITNWIRNHDPSRLVNSASGWSDRGTGQVHDIHSYPGPAICALEEERAAVLGEFGGLGLPVEEHTWQEKENWGYRSYDTREALTEAYVELLARLRPLIGEGLAAAIYTQTSDVEIEVNGLMTYDRALIKMDAERIAAAARKLYLPPPVILPVVESSKEKAKFWQYTAEDPGEGWELPGFDDSGWKEGVAGFGTDGTPGSMVRTLWDSSDIWIRRKVSAEREWRPGALQLRVHHDEDAEVYLGGVRIAELEGYTTSYVLVPLGEEAERALRAGETVLAVHCRQTGGGQYIDVGLVEVEEAGE